jgi:hypothetical protein
MKNLKLTEQVKYKHKKDNSIIILKETFLSEKNKSLHKYTAEKNSIFAKSFPSEEDAVKELNRKLKSSNNNQNQKQMSKLDELKKQLALSQSQLTTPFIAGNPVLKASTENKISELKNAIAELESSESKDEKIASQEKTTQSTDDDLDRLKKELELTESQIGTPFIQGNPVLKASAENKLKELKSRIAELSGGSKEKQVKTQPVQKTEKKVEKIQKVEKKVEKKIEKKKTEPKVEKKKIEKVEGLKIKVGDKVTFEERETGKKVTGELVKLEPTHAGDAYNAYVMTKDGKKKVRAHKLTKV